MRGDPERRSRVRGGRRATVGVALLGLAFAGALAAAVSQGYVVVDGSSDSALAPGVPEDRAVADTGRGLVMPEVAASRPDDAVRLRASRDSTGVPPLPRATADGPMAATAAELETLRTTLIIPVPGVSREQLVDSFDDARGPQGARGADTLSAPRRHAALDIMAPRGTPVVSAAAGRVLKLFDSPAGGLMVYASDPTGRFVLLYGHLDRFAEGLREGAAVRQGETIGYVGTTGNAAPNAPHLHFGVARTDDPTKWWGGTPVNPYPLLR